MRVLGYSLAALCAIVVTLYFAFFFNPQSEEQEAMNAAWGRFAEDVVALSEVIENAPTAISRCHADVC